MKIDCLISCYNYREYVTEAIRSALDQPRRFQSVIVVDDGSTDGSAEAIGREFRGCSRVRLIRKPNEGQLSCFNEAFAASDADLLCFLDADDVYLPNYLERVAEVYEQRPEVDFVYTQHELIGDVSGQVGGDAGDFDHGYSALLVQYLGPWIGAPTSCLSLRRSLAARILPIPFLDQWKTRADDCLVFGASLVGGRKFRLGEPLVNYRVHDRNHFYGRSCSSGTEFARRMAVNQLFKYLTDRASLSMPGLAEYTALEFVSQPVPWSYRRLRKYLRIARRVGLPWRRRWSIAKALWRLYLRQPKRDQAAAAGSLQQARRAA